MKKVLFLSTGLPSRLGGVRSLYYNMLAFSRRFEVHFIRINKEDPDLALMGIPRFVKFSEMKAGAPSFDLSALLLPLHAKSAMKIHSASGRIQDYIEKNGIDAVVTHSMDVSLALRGLRAKAKIANQIDSFAAYYSSKQKAAGTVISAAMERLQLFLYFFIERMLFSNFDLVSYVSYSDISGAYRDSPKVFVINQGRDPPLRKMNAAKRPNGVVLLGRWEHPPNRDGLFRIAQELGRIRGGVKIIGPNMPRSLRFSGNVKVLGMVKDVGKELSNSKICLIPVWYGAGLQTKVFDALRHGCVVATTGFTKAAFEANSLPSSAIKYSDDPVSAASSALAEWSSGSSKAAYRDYLRFYKAALKQEDEYVLRAWGLVGGK